MIDFLFVLIVSSLAGSVMIAAVKILDFFLRKHGAKLQYLLMRITLFMYLLSAVTITVTTYQSRVLYIQSGEIEDFPYVEHVTGWGLQEAFGTDVNRYLRMILLIWMAGFILVGIAGIIRETKMIRRILKFSTRYESESFEKSKQELLRQLKIKKNVKVFQSPLVETPFTTGVFRPKVVLPKQRFSEEELGIILKHEFTHLKRKETFYKLAMGLMKGVNWFNPVIIFFAKEFNNYSELTCDELVMENEGKEIRFQYSKLLLEIAGGGLDRETVAALKNGNERTIERRIINIMKGNRKVGRFATVLVSAAFLGMCGMVISVSANSAVALEKKVVEEKRAKSGIEEKVGLFEFPESNKEFVGVPRQTEVNGIPLLLMPDKEKNQIEVEVEIENMFVLKDVTVGEHVRFNLFSKSEQDKFQAGILNLNTGEYKYVDSYWGGVTHTFYITRPGKYVAFIKNENFGKETIGLFGNIYNTYQ